MIEVYLAGAALTGFHLYSINKPKGVEWLAWLAFVVGWPLLVVTLAFVAIMDRIKSR